MTHSSSRLLPLDVRGAIRVLGLITGLGLVGTTLPAAAYECSPLEPAAPAARDVRHDHGLLWRVSGHGHKPSYVFGTMHVADPDIVAIPAPVHDKLAQADRFVMEAQLDGPEALQFAQDMFYRDGTRLSSLLPEELYARAEQLLAGYGMPPAMIKSLKPWAAFMTLNMPPDTGLPLDMVLMQQAARQGIAVSGLESLAEQAAVLEQLSRPTQVALLLDSICHYATLQRDLEDMKRLYLQRDLQALFNYHDKYQIHSDSRYRHLLKRLLWDRNRTMVERMRPYLAEGNAFIAIGAMHLPGEEGVLSLLEQAGYRVKSLY